MGFLKWLAIPFFVVSYAHATTVTTPNMNLALPVPGTTSGPVWAQMLNTALTKIDQHTHAPGAGVLVPTAGLNINTDLPMHGFNLVLPRSLMLTNNVATLATPNDINNVYAVNGDLYYNNASGTPVQITSGNAINAAGIGGISGLGGTSGAETYSDITKTFTFTQSSGKTANIAAGSYSLYENILGANPINLKSPASLGSSYDLTFFSALPLTKKIVTLTSGGALAADYDVDGSTLEISSNNLRVKDLGITTAKLADNAVTTVKITDGNVTSAKLAAPIGTVTNILADTTYTVPANVHLIQVMLVGGGGGGGNGNDVPSGVGGGGGGGGMITVQTVPVTPAATYAVTIGGGGGPNAPGGTTSFGSILKAFGGSPGATGANGGAGGSPGIGAGSGGNAGTGSSDNATAGSVAYWAPGVGGAKGSPFSDKGGGGGGGGSFGTGGIGGTYNSAGTSAAANSGAGGGGASAGPGAGSPQSGGSGRVVITVLN